MHLLDYSQPYFTHDRYNIRRATRLMPSRKYDDITTTGGVPEIIRSRGPTWLRVSAGAWDQAFLTLGYRETFPSIDSASIYFCKPTRTRYCLVFIFSRGEVKGSIKVMMHVALHRGLRYIVLHRRHSRDPHMRLFNVGNGDWLHCILDPPNYLSRPSS